MQCACVTESKEIAKRWRNLRSSHRRYLSKKSKAQKRSGDGADSMDDVDDDSTDDSYLLWEAMSYLQPHMSIHSSTSNFVSAVSVVNLH